MIVDCFRDREFNKRNGNERNTVEMSVNGLSNLFVYECIFFFLGRVKIKREQMDANKKLRG